MKFNLKPQLLRFFTLLNTDSVDFKNKKILGRRCAWGVTACFEQTQQIKAANRNLLGRRSFFGGLLGTHGRPGATVPPYNESMTDNESKKI